MPPQMNFAYWLQIVITLGPMLIVMGIVFEKVRQLEHRLNGNGPGIPGRCSVHKEKLGGHERRIAALEQEPHGELEAK